MNTCLSACWLFRQELLVCHVNRKREKDMLKQQDMTETARVVFNELSVFRTGDSRGDSAEYLPFTRTLPVNTDPAGYGGSGRLSVRLLQTPSAVKAFLFVVNGRLVGVRGTHQPSAHALGSQANLRPTALRKSRMSLSETGLMIHA